MECYCPRLTHAYGVIPDANHRPNGSRYRTTVRCRIGRPLPDRRDGRRFGVSEKCPNPNSGPGDHRPRPPFPCGGHGCRRRPFGWSIRSSIISSVSPAGRCDAGFEALQASRQIPDEHVIKLASHALRGERTAVFYFAPTRGTKHLPILDRECPKEPVSLHRRRRRSCEARKHVMIATC